VKVKVKIRLQSTSSTPDADQEVEKIRQILLQRCPELILGKPRPGSNPKYAGKQKWASYGDFWLNKIRKRRS